MKPEAHINITVYRTLYGIRTPYVIKLDRMRNVVSDEVDSAELARIKNNPFLLARHRIQQGDARTEAHAALIQSQGLHKYVTDSGIVISREPPDEWTTQFEAWLDSGKPNPFPGTEDLRTEYFQEVSDVQERINAGNCPGCELTKTQVRFRVKLRTHLAL